MARSGGRTIEKLLRQQAALAQFGTFAFSEVTLPPILTEAARVCAASLGVPFCKVCRYRADENDLLIVAGVGWHAGVVGKVVSRADASSPQGRAFVTRNPVLIRNLRQSNEIVLPDFYAEHNIVSTIDVVIQTRAGVPYGVLEIDSPLEHLYDRHDIDFLTGFTNVLAEAVAKVERTDMLRAALAERDALLREKAMLAAESQHRVRNNLQSLHMMISAQLNPPDGTLRPEGFAAIARRLTTMMVVYDQLLDTGLSHTLDVATYLRALCAALAAGQDVASDDVTLTCDSDALSLDAKTLTTLGMVVAELVANSYKHAFPNRPGRIAVTLRLSPADDNRPAGALLTVRDDGVGLRAAQQVNKRYGLGLVAQLASQIGGSVAGPGDGGTGAAWQLWFPLPG